MRFYYSTLIIVLLLVGSGRCFSQGFLNLNSESPNVSGYSPGELVPTQSALPDWSAYFEPANNSTNSGSAPAPGYAGNSIGGAVIAVQDTNASPAMGPIQGKHSASLDGSISTAATIAALSQTDTMPVTAQSLVFSTNVTGTLDVSLDGHALTLVDVSNAMNCTVHKVNFPAYAGQTGPSVFMSPLEAATVLDNGQDSASIAPDLNTFDGQP